MIEENLSTETKVNIKPSRNRGRGRSRTTAPVAQDKKEEVTQIALPLTENELAHYVSNTEGNVYAITNLPEEFIATLFAWVSRSSKSFKEHLQEAITEFELPPVTADPFSGLSKKAKAFHEKWTVGYGHSSVAEHAVAHVGIEGISRLASAELELANGFLSITEYSQRYQKPKRGGWTNPLPKMISHDGPTRDMIPNPLYDEVEEFFDKAYDLFGTLISGVYASLFNKKTDNGALTISKQQQDELMKLAFEDARYVLPLSMHTQLGMTSNGRAWRDALATLGLSDHAESRKLSEDLRTEITKVLPVLLKYARPSQYQANSKKRITNALNKKNENENSNLFKVNLQIVEDERQVIHQIVALLIMENEGHGYSQAYNKVKSMTDDQRKLIIKDLLHEMESFDVAPNVFKHVKYEATVLVSEANWHQLLRHNRKTDFTFGPASPYFDITIPPRILESPALSEFVKGIAEQSKELYTKLVEAGFEKEAEYVVLNAHNRQIFMSFDLQQAYHLINLRTSDEAQWDIRNIFEQLDKQLKTVHPLLLSKAKRR